VRKIALKELVRDFDIYPRSQVDSTHAGGIRRAIKEGVELPPLVICKKTKRIVDGFHRYKANLDEYGPDHEIEVIEKTYRSEKAILLDAMKYNASHGKPMTPYDHARCLHLAATLEVEDRELAKVLHVDSNYVAELRVERTAEDAGVYVPLKHTIKHKAGAKLTKRQALANKKLGGMNQAFYANQLIELIEADLIDVANENLMARLEVLKGLLGVLFENVE
jgi:hypothetical protein